MAQDKPPNRDCAPGPPRPWETVKGVPRQSGYAVTVTKPACALACLVVLVLHLRSSVQVVVVDGTQGWGELPEARRGALPAGCASLGGKQVARPRGTRTSRPWGLGMTLSVRRSRTTVQSVQCPGSGVVEVCGRLLSCPNLLAASARHRQAGLKKSPTLSWSTTRCPSTTPTNGGGRSVGGSPGGVPAVVSTADSSLTFATGH